MKKAILPVLIASALALTACGGGGGHRDEPVTTPTTPPIQAAVNARYQIVLKDVATDAPVTDPLTITFSGSAALKAADGTVLNGKTVTTTSGFYAVDAEFSASAKDFTIRVADAGTKGWVGSGSTITGEAAASGDKLVEVKLLNTNKVAEINAAPAPVAMATQTSTVQANGALAQPITLSSPTKAVTTTEGTSETLPTTKLSISAGTIAKSATGQPAAPGPLTVASTVFANSSATSLQAMPGGFTPSLDVPAGNTAVLNGATTTDAALITGGFAEFSVKDSQGNEIRTFDQPITVSIDLRKGTEDANGDPVTAGSEFPVWSFNEATQSWVFEKMGQVSEKSPVDPDFFSVTFDTLHLSWWNLAVIRTTCSAQINVSGRPAADTRSLELEVVGTRGSRFSRNAVTASNSFTLSRAPRGTRATISIKDKGVVIGQVADTQLCSGAITVPVTIAAAATGIVRFETSESCANGSNQRAVPTYAGVQVNTNYTPAYTSTVEANVATTTVTGQPAGSVVARAFNPRTSAWESATVTVPADGTVVVPFRFTASCSTVTGGIGG